MARKQMTPRGPTPQILKEIQNVAEISVRDRQILLLRLAGVTLPDIAREMNLTAPTVSTIIKHSLQRIVAEPAKQIVALQRARAEQVLSIAWDGLQRAMGNVNMHIPPDDRAIVVYLASVDRAMARLDVYYNIARTEASEEDYKKLAREGSEIEEMFVRWQAIRKARLALPSPNGDENKELEK